jgi:acyl-CoA synthetase
LQDGYTINGCAQALPSYDEKSFLSLDARAFSDEELFLLNSTSGTTGMPKCVAHSSHRWFYYHQLLLETAAFDEHDVFMSCISGTFGFGLWTSRFSPTILGLPCVISRKFSPEEAIARIHQHKVTVLAAVSTQFIMMLASPEMRSENFTSLRYLYTGGESVPREKSVEFETITGAHVLQFYGSNETGALSATRVSDSRDKRLGTAGRPFSQMQVRLNDSHGDDVTATGYGRAACKGAANCLGYYNDIEAQKELYTDDGWMLTGDYVRIDEAGYLHVEGRAGDFIIRGGKNISALAVEEAVLTIPNVRVAAAIAVPDAVFGEKVAIIVELKDKEQALHLEALRAHLKASDYSVETIPELLYVVDAMPLSSGGKIAKGTLRSRYGA